MNGCQTFYIPKKVVKTDIYGLSIQPTGRKTRNNLQVVSSFYIIKTSVADPVPFIPDPDLDPT